MKSTHKVEVVNVRLEKHPNADKLSIVHVWDYVVVVRTEDWKNGDLGAYIVPDTMVPLHHPEFKFLDTGKGRDFERVKVRKFRGSMSQGLLIPAPEGSIEGDDVSSLLGTYRYEPSIDRQQLPKLPKRKLPKWKRYLNKIGFRFKNGPVSVKPPGDPIPKYDVDAGLRYARIVLNEGETVWITEKIHGCNARYTWRAAKKSLFTAWLGPKKGRMWAGSRNMWPIKRKNNLWWRILAKYPEIEVFCKEHPGAVIFGEIYGSNVQDLEYGKTNGEVDFAVFDIAYGNDPGRGTRWLQPEAARKIGSSLPWVPTLYQYWSDWTFSDLQQLADNQDSLIPGANHMAEGVVIKPIFERKHHTIGRVQLKFVSNRYLERSK